MIFDVRRACAVGALLDGITVWAVGVAHRDDLVGAGMVGSIEKAGDAAAGAYHSDTQSVVRAEDACGCQGGQAAGKDKATTAGVVSHGAHHSESMRGKKEEASGPVFAL